jgi:phosphomannomutase
LVEADDFSPVEVPGIITKTSFREHYIAELLTLVDLTPGRPLKIAINSVHGCAGPVIDLIAPHLSCEFVRLQHEPDSLSSQIIHNPMGLQTRISMRHAIRSQGANLGILLDGDFDRCFLFDEDGHFIENYYTMGLLCEALLQHRPGETVIHDASLIWNTQEIVRRFGGHPVQGKLGQVFISEQLCNEDAIYGGDIDGHHYFRAFSGCSSGMLAWLLIVSLLGRKEQPLSQLIAKMKSRYPVSGQISYRVDNPSAVIDKIWYAYEAEAISSDFSDGISLDMGLWRFSLRCSQSGELLRMNVETNQRRDLMEEKTAELIRAIKAYSAAVAQQA